MSGPIVVAALCASLAVAWPRFARRRRATDRLAEAAEEGALPAVALRGPQIRSRSATPHRPRPATASGVAFAVDLLAAALAAGATLPDALDAAGPAVASLALPFGRAADALRMGGDLAEAMGDDPALRRLARCAVRAELHGAAAGATLGRLAAELRAEETAAAAERARRAGVHVVAPLVLCFLPAFVLLAVVPLVLGLASTSAGP